MKKQLLLMALVTTVSGSISATDHQHSGYHPQHCGHHQQEEKASRQTTYGFATVLGAVVGAADQVRKEPNSDNMTILWGAAKGAVAANAGMIAYRETADPEFMPRAVKAPVCVGGIGGLMYWMLNK